MVVMLVDPATNNGSDTCPAVITRVWSDKLVNVRTLNDSESIQWKTSVSLFDTEDDARANGGHACFWPPRT